MGSDSPNVVTIDGPAGTGKSTAARTLASRLGWSLLDTGAMYRAVALAALQAGLDGGRSHAWDALVSRLHFEQRGTRFWLDGQDVTEAIRAPEVGALASQVAEQPAVRTVLANWQRAAAVGPVVTEGRDQGTVVFPNAFCKFYLTANPQARAQRRFEEQRARGAQVSLDDVLSQQAERDTRDAGRAIAPMKPAADATIVDTSSLPAPSVHDLLEALTRTRLQHHNRPEPPDWHSILQQLGVVYSTVQGWPLRVAGTRADLEACQSEVSSNTLTPP